MARIQTYIEVQEIAGEDILVLTDASNSNATKTTNIDDLVSYFAENAEFAGTFIYPQETAAPIWTIAHNLDKYPSVTIIDEYNRQFEGHVEYRDNNTVIVTLSAPIKGKAYLN